VVVSLRRLRVLQSTLQPAVCNAGARAAIDEDQRAAGLNSLRLSNFRRLIDRLTPLIEGPGRRLLDVGCAHGWFLDAAREGGFESSGVEPDPAISARAAVGERHVWAGFFPDCVPPGQSFDVIVFNDVFEHLPDITAAAKACRQLLRPGGILILNVPCSTGIFYRIATLLDRLGISGPLERLWQKQFASPHLWYFAPDQLRRFAGNHGFRGTSRNSAKIYPRKGHYDRLRAILGLSCRS